MPANCSRLFLLQKLNPLNKKPLSRGAFERYCYERKEIQNELRY
jgi:hypothetical protein